MATTPRPQISTDPRRELVDRILASRAFAKSPRLRDFLAYVTEHSLTGNAAALTEAEIAVQVFGRHDFVASDDSLVRVSARQLRVKLKDYFLLEGCAEDLLIDIPRGGYAPVFESRLAATVPEPAPEPKHVRWPTALIAFAGINVILLIANIFWSGYFTRPQAAPPLHSLLEEYLAASQTPVRVVVSDYSLPLMRALAESPAFGLAEYSRHDYSSLQPPPQADERLRRLFEILRTHQITRLGDLNTVLSIVRASAGRVTVNVTHARDLTAREFKSGRYILLGNPSSTPWIELFDGKMQFPFVRDSNGVGFVNTHPRPGEPVEFRSRDAATEKGEGFARVALIPNPQGKDPVLVISGINMVTMEAAGEFIADPSSITELTRTLGIASLRPLPNFEVILQSKSLDNTPQRAHILAARLLKF